MKKKMIEPEKSYFVKVPSRLTDIIQKSGLSGTNEYAYKGIFIDINEVFMRNCANKPYIRRSVIEEAFRRGYRLKCKMLDKVLSNKWLFYSQIIESGADALIQPIFDMNRMNEKKISSLLRAIGKGDYSRLQKLVPNEVSRFNIYSNSLFKDEEVDTEVSLICHNSQTSAPACDGSELTPKTAQNELPTGEPTGEPTGKPTGSTPIISTRVGDIENMRVGDKENKRFNLEGKKDSGPLVREAQPEPSLPPYQKTELDVITKERSWDEYLDNLKVDSKEMQSLLHYAAEDRPLIENNFEEFIFHMKNRCNFRKKDECQLTKSDAGKNEYIYNLLKNKSERRNLVKHIQESIEAKRRREISQGKPGYPFDFYNKQGQRISSGRIVPNEAPPRPSNAHFWNGTKWIHR